MSYKMRDAFTSSLLQLGDDALILGQRLCEWCGHAPTIEVDLSLSNLALDLIGQSTMLLEYAGTVEGAGRSADHLAFHRDAEEFRNCLLVEQPNGDFAQTIVRHYLYSLYAYEIYQNITHSKDAYLADIAAKACKELRYHVEFSADWLERLAGGTEESLTRTLSALDWHWRFLDDMFEDDENWLECVKQSIMPSRLSVRQTFDHKLKGFLEKLNMERPKSVWQVTGGRTGRHSEHLSTMLAIMQSLPRAHPEAIW